MGSHQGGSQWLILFVVTWEQIVGIGGCVIVLGIPLVIAHSDLQLIVGTMILSQMPLNLWQGTLW